MGSRLRRKVPSIRGLKIITPKRKKTLMVFMIAIDLSRKEPRLSLTIGFKV